MNTLTPFEIKSFPRSIKSVSRHLRANQNTIGWLRRMAKRMDKFDTIVSRRKVVALGMALATGPVAYTYPNSRNKHVANMLRSARKTLKEAAEWSTEDILMTAMLFRDAADYLQIARYLEAGKIRQAENFVSWMDTAARDGIDSDTYEFMDKINREDVD